MIERLKDWLRDHGWEWGIEAETREYEENELASYSDSDDVRL